MRVVQLYTYILWYLKYVIMKMWFCVYVSVCVYENSKSNNALNVFLGTPFSLKKDLMKLATKIEL